jgi:tetratricopeptide (TPR) repeat protein
MSEMLFLSCVSAEFKSYRLKLANQLAAVRGREFEVKVQEDFQQGGFTLLEQLADYIRDCDVVVHLVGEACGASPTPEHVQALCAKHGIAPEPRLSELSYTQWEYELARRFGRHTLVYLAAPEAPRDGGLPVAQSPAEAVRQQAHRARIEASGEMYKLFSGQIVLVREVFFDLGLNPETCKPNNLPFRSIGSLFKGRDDFLLQIRDTLGGVQHRGHRRAAAIVSSKDAAGIHGLGGIGKTRAAIEYAHRYRDDYTALLFVQAESPAAMQANLAALCGADVLDLAQKSVADQEAQVGAVLRWLREHPGWFLILDNVDSREAAAAAEKLLADLSHAGHVLVTSRLRDWSGSVEPLALDVLSEDASVEFLLERTERGRRTEDDDPEDGDPEDDDAEDGDPEDDDAEDGDPEDGDPEDDDPEDDDAEQARFLSVDLGQLALALEQAGAYIVRHRLTFAQYREEWVKWHDRVLEWFDERVMQYPASVAVTWQTSFDRLEEPARDLLRLLAWLAPDPIPESLLEVPIPNSRLDELALRDALADLEAYSLVTRDADSPAFTVHRLVQDVTRRGLAKADDNRVLECALNWIHTAFAGDPRHPDAWPVMGSVVRHVVAVTNSAHEAEICEPTPWLMNRGGTFLEYARGDFAGAEPLYRRALEVRERVLGPEHPDTLVSVNNLAGLLESTGDYAGAEPLYRRALEARERVLGPEHPSTLVSVNNLAGLLYRTGDYAGAEPLYRRALEASERVLGPEHPDTLTSVNNLAALLESKGDCAGAEPLYRRAVEALERVLGAEHPDTLTSVSNLALLLYSKGDCAVAEPLFRRALEARERVLGAEHPDTLTSVDNLAFLLKSTGDYAGAEPLCRRALEARERVLGAEHPDTLGSVNNLALLLCGKGDCAGAEPLFRRALEARERVLGAEHPDTLGSVISLAGLLYSKGDYAGAEPFYRRALEARERVLGAEHPDTLECVNNLAGLLYRKDDYASAEPLLRRALEGIAKLSVAIGRVHPNLQTFLGNYVMCLRGLGRDEVEIQTTVNGVLNPFGFGSELSESAGGTD